MLLTITPNPSIDIAVFVAGRLKVSDRNEIRGIERYAGGKGANVARTYARLGGRARASGFVGGLWAAEFLASLEADHVEERFIPIKESIRINYSIEDTTGAAPTQLSEVGPLIQAAESDQLIRSLPSLGAGADFATLNGSLPQGLAATFYARIVKALPESCKVGLDADGEPLRLGLAARPHFVKPNENEASRLLGRRVQSDDEAIEAAREIRAMVKPCGFALLSRGDRGAILSSADGDWLGRPPIVEVQSTVGCGDAMVAGMVWALGEGHSLPEAFRWSLACGAATAATRRASFESSGIVRRLLPGTEVIRL